MYGTALVDGMKKASLSAVSATVSSMDSKQKYSESSLAAPPPCTQRNRRLASSLDSWLCACDASVLGFRTGMPTLEDRSVSSLSCVRA